VSALLADPLSLRVQAQPVGLLSLRVQAQLAVPLLLQVPALLAGQLSSRVRTPLADFPRRQKPLLRQAIKLTGPPEQLY